MPRRNPGGWTDGKRTIYWRGSDSSEEKRLADPANSKHQALQPKSSDIRIKRCRAANALSYSSPPALRLCGLLPSSGAPSAFARGTRSTRCRASRPGLRHLSGEQPPGFREGGGPDHWRARFTCVTWPSRRARCRPVPEPRARNQATASAHPTWRIPGPLVRQRIVPAPLEPASTPTPRAEDRRPTRLLLVSGKDPLQKTTGHPASFVAQRLASRVLVEIRGSLATSSRQPGVRTRPPSREPRPT